MGGVIRRHPAAAASAPYDMVVIGGGIYGVAVAHRATHLATSHTG